MQLIPYLFHQFAGIIWRIEIDPITVTLFAEIRSEEDKQVSFASFNLITGIVNFDNLVSDERWLTGMESACNGVLLLHNYQSPGSPEHKGLIVIDGETGQTLWQDYNLAYNHLTLKGPVVFNTRIQPRKLFTADIKTGTPISAYNGLADVDFDNSIALPKMVSADSIDGCILPETPYGNIVFNLYYKDYRIVSLHALKNDTLNQSLYIFKDSRQVYHDILNTGIQKLQPEAFVLHRHYLIYLKNRSGLNVVNLEN